jgi:hypothetical protein
VKHTDLRKRLFGKRPGGDEQVFTGNVAVDEMMWLQIHWMANLYGVRVSQVLKLAISWAYFTKKADVRVRHALRTPTDPDTWLVPAGREDSLRATISLNFTSEMYNRIGTLIDRVGGLVKDPWPKDRDRMACVLEAVWEAFRSHFRDLTFLGEAPLPVTTSMDPSLVKLRKHIGTYEFRKRHLPPGLVERENDPVDDPEEDG